ncbi:hypothetical protein [Capillibacterium thermochitinicola]|uniref:Prepilin-type N-terminal cleavage/methylation domain-containing protein n=1 Tax=Capillibacterium thermochitinicola TaxID=2699427 RepID=A0A8J6I0B2_9FIRM|nr:hypothetical protein [Capillibacterium thermochitinicola]MBA2133375.1 hypothetical protein [Capillibacterium thermochitinicola]
MTRFIPACPRDKRRNSARRDEERTAGFTLFEVVAVLALITLLYSIFIYDFDEAARRLTERIDLKQVEADLQTLRAESLGRPGDYRCRFFPNERFYLLQMDDTVLNRSLKTLAYTGLEELELVFARFEPVTGEIRLGTPQGREYRLLPNAAGYFEVVRE